MEGGIAGAKRISGTNQKKSCCKKRNISDGVCFFHRLRPFKLILVAAVFADKTIADERYIFVVRRPGWYVYCALSAEQAGQDPGFFS